MRKTLPIDKIHSSTKAAVADFHIETINEIEKAVATNEWVVVGMAQNPFVKKARKMLTEKAIPFHYIEHGSYFSDWQKRLAIKLWSGWPTFPQVFHNGTLIGGADDLKKYLSEKKQF